LATAGRPFCGWSCTRSGGGCATITDCGLGAVNSFKEGQMAVGRARLRNPSDAYPRRLQAQANERDGGRFRRPAPPRSGSKPVLSMDLRWDTLSCPGSVGVGRCRGSSGRLVGRRPWRTPATAHNGRWTTAPMLYSPSGGAAVLSSSWHVFCRAEAAIPSLFGPIAPCHHLASVGVLVRPELSSCNGRGSR